MKESILVHLAKTHKVSIAALEEVKYHVSKFIQGDIGLESHVQIILTVVLLLLANSETRTITGLEVLFENATFFYMPTSLALALSIAWSLLSCVKSHIKGISKKQTYSTIPSMILMIFFTAISIVLRVFSYVLFLTPSLGLFGILRHLQGEMYPFHLPYFDLVDVKDNFYFGHAPNISWAQITRWNYVEKQEATPPDGTLYSYFTIEQYFGILTAIFGFNTVLQGFVKRLTNPLIFHELTWIDCIIHSISCCFIPHPMEEWDERPGSVLMHQQRQSRVFKEMVASIMVNFSVNILLLSPLILLGFNIFERHAILINSIGAFQSEIEAFEQIKVMISIGYALLLLLTVTQLITYYLYNGKFHPFSIIVSSPRQTLHTPMRKQESESAEDFLFLFENDTFESSDC